MPPILEAHNLVKHYGNFAAVKGISFHIDTGEIFSLLGPNGAGKPTTISVLATLLAPTGGEARSWTLHHQEPYGRAPDHWRSAPGDRALR